MSQLSGIKACVFDAYGTMFDVHSPVKRLSATLGNKVEAVSSLWRDKQLQYTWLRSLMGDFAPFSKVTEDALIYALKANNIDNQALQKQLFEAYYTLDAYEDVGPCLEKLRQRGFKIAILSNGSPDMLDAAVTSSALSDKIDAVLSVDDVQVNKPDKRVYQMPLHHFAIEAHEVCFVSNNAWDCHGGAHFGYQVARLNRNNTLPEKLSGEPKVILNDMTGLAEILM